MKVETRTMMTSTMAATELTVCSSGTWWIHTCTQHRKYYLLDKKIFAEQTLALTWWSTLMLTTLASRKPRITAEASEVGRNSRPVMKVECAFLTRFTRARL